MTSYLHRVRSFSPDIKLLLVYCLLANIGFGVTELIFNFYLLELGYREDFIGEWRAVQTLAVAGASLTLGHVINRFGAWRSILVGFSVMCASSFALGLTEQRQVLLGLAVVYGASLAYLMNPVLPFIMEFERPDQRQHASAVSLSINSFSLMIGSLIGGFAPELFSKAVPSIQAGSIAAYRAAMLTGASFALLALIPLFLMNEPRRVKIERRKSVAVSEESPAQRKQVRGDITAFVVMGGLMSIGVGMVWPFYNVFLKSLGASADQVGYVFALGSLFAAIFGLAAPMISTRMGMLSSTLWLRLSIVPLFLPLIFAPALPFAVLAYFWRQSTASMAWPVEATFVSEVLPARARATVFGLRSSAWNLGYAAATYFAGRIIVERGYSLTFVVFVVFSVVSALVYYFYYIRHPKVVDGSITHALSPANRQRIRERSTRIDGDVGESDLKLGA